MVGHRPRVRQHAFDRVQPVHRRPGAGHAPPIGEVARITDRPGSRAEEVGIERQDGVCLLEPINRIHVLAEGEPGAFARTVASGRLVLMPLRCRKLGKQSPKLIGQRR